MKPNRYNRHDKERKAAIPPAGTKHTQPAPPKHQSIHKSIHYQLNIQSSTYSDNIYGVSYLVCMICIELYAPATHQTKPRITFIIHLYAVMALYGWAPISSPTLLTYAITHIDVPTICLGPTMVPKPNQWTACTYIYHTPLSSQPKLTPRKQTKGRGRAGEHNGLSTKGFSNLSGTVGCAIYSLQRHSGLQRNYHTQAQRLSKALCCNNKLSSRGNTSNIDQSSRSYHTYNSHSPECWK